MKFRLFALLAGFLSLTACKKEMSITADFSIDKDQCDILEDVQVKNLSRSSNVDIGLYHWEWDGKESFEREIGAISFAHAGEYTVTLTVFAEQGVIPPVKCTRIIRVADGVGPDDPDDPEDPEEPGALDPDKNFYVTVTGAGTGDGSSWANALSAAGLWEKIHLDGSDTETDDTKRAAIAGATFHMGAGDYELNEHPVLGFDKSNPLYIAFKGDYPAAGGDSQVRGGAQRANFTGKGSHAALILRGKLNVTFDGIGFIGGYGTDDEDAQGVAAALDCDGEDESYVNSGISVSMQYCTVKDNTNESYKSGSHEDEWGAGIRLRAVASFQADSVTFARNTSHAAAAVTIRRTEDAVFTRCKFLDNLVYHRGGAVYAASGCTVTFDDCTFRGNQALTSRGGAVFMSGRPTVTFKGCSFTGNKAPEDNGGAIAVDAGLAILEGCLLQENEAGWGGAICVEANSDGAGLRIAPAESGERTRLLRNVSTNKGGAICAYTQSQDEGKDVRIDKAVFQGNHSQAGGAIYVQGNNTGFHLTDSDFGGTGDGEPNYSEATKGNDMGAGSIYLFHRSPAVISGCRFVGDHSNRWGGAIFCNTSSGSDVTVENCHFQDCSSANGWGGAIAAGFSNFGMLTVKGGSFTNCSAQNGGAILVDGNNNSQLKVYPYNDTEGTLFKGNHTLEGRADHQRGGAIKVQNNPTVMIYRASFIGNYAGHGGAIQTSNEPTIFMDACSFDGNYITRKWGSTIYIGEAGNYLMNNCSIRGSYTTNPDPEDINNARPAWIYFEYVANKISISNSSIIGDPTYYDGESFTPLTSNNTCLVCTCGTAVYLTNSIVMPTSAAVHSIGGDYADGAHEEMDVFYSHYKDLYGYRTVTDNGGNSSGWTASDLGGLAWADGAWTWNGSIGGAEPGKTGMEDIYNRLNGISPDFVSWLAENFGYDQLHTDRGTTLWWPGAWQQP